MVPYLATEYTTGCDRNGNSIKRIHLRFSDTGWTAGWANSLRPWLYEHKVGAKESILIGASMPTVRVSRKELRELERVLTP